jgi:type IV fimbrial biogenesis protein FimT
MKHRLRGVTLIELMITLAVAIVLLAIGIPAFQSMQASGRLNSQTMALVTALNAARSEAVGRGIPVAVCARASDTSCGTDWTNGWLLFTDAAPAVGVCTSCNNCTDANFQNRTCDIVLKVFAPTRGEGRGTGTPPLRALEASADFVQFNSRGEQTGAVFRARSSQRDGLAGSDRCLRVGLTGQIVTQQGTYDQLGDCPL